MRALWGLAGVAVLMVIASLLSKNRRAIIMVGGLASVAGSTLVGYSLLGAPLEYLLAATFMTAPAALLMAKIMMPETEEPESRTPAPEDRAVTEDQFLEYRNVIDAAAPPTASVSPSTSGRC